MTYRMLEEPSVPPLAGSESWSPARYIDISWISTDFILGGQVDEVCRNYGARVYQHFRQVSALRSPKNWLYVAAPTPIF